MLPCQCLVCGELVNTTDDKFMLGVEVPYINLYMHKLCWLSIKDTYAEFLQANLENYMSNIEKNRKK